LNKIAVKHLEGRCRLCGVDDYAVLDCHRLQPGSKYVEEIVAVLCSNCHRRTHAGEVRLDTRTFLRSDGRRVLRVWEPDGTERWI
jgi:hypothetical protein